MDSKTLEKSRSANNLRSGTTVRGRDAEFPSAPVHVSKDAQSRKTSKPTLRQFAPASPPNALPDRPRTSGGQSSKQRNILQDHKALTRDDLHTLVKHHQNGSSLNFPMPKAPPTPDATPQPSPDNKHNLSSYGQESIDSSSGKMNEDLPIGMALGSPTHHSSPRTWQSQGPSLNERVQQPRQTQPQQVYQASPQLQSRSQFPSPQPQLQRQHTRQQQPLSQGLERVPTASPGMAYDLNSNVPAMPKSSKWKMFGLFGGGKKSSPQSNDVAVGKFPSPPPIPVEQERPRTRGRSSSTAKQPRVLKEPKRANTEPVTPSAAAAGTPTIRVKGDGLMLNVDIPDITMERYSVMFGSVLNPGGPGGPGAQQSSLLARRQATLERLRTNKEESITEKEEDEPSKYLRPRGVSSPVVTKSPAGLSLFPSTPSKSHQDHSTKRGPSPLHRSNTSPAALSPARPSFDRAPSTESRKDGEITIGFSPVAVETIQQALPERPFETLVQKHVEVPVQQQSVPNQKMPEQSQQGVEKKHLDKPVQHRSNSAEKLEPDLSERAAERTYRPIRNDRKVRKVVERPSERQEIPVEKTPEQAQNHPVPLKSALKKPLHIVTTRDTTSWVSAEARLDLSPESMSPSEGIDERTMRHDASEPQWTMVKKLPKPNGNSISSASTVRSTSSGEAAHSAATSQSSADSPTITAMSKLPPTSAARVSSDDDYKREEALRTAAEISIARQISVSQSQRRMLNLVPSRARNTSVSSTQPISPEGTRIRSPSEPTSISNSSESLESTKTARPAPATSRSARENPLGDISPLARSPSNAGAPRLQSLNNSSNSSSNSVASVNSKPPGRLGSVARARARAESAAAAMAAAAGNSASSSPMTMNHASSLTRQPYVSTIPASSRPSAAATVSARLDAAEMARVGMKFGEARKGSISVVEADDGMAHGPGNGSGNSHQHGLGQAQGMHLSPNGGGNAGRTVYSHKHKKSERAVLEEA